MSEVQNLPLAGGGQHTCACGCSDEGVPELDATVIPHAIRHATIFGALDSIPVGGSMVLKAPHNPLPLLDQIQGRWGEGFSWTYLEEGPQDWRLQFTREQ